MHVSIREETPADVPAIHRVNAAAFPTAAEAALVDALRDGSGLALSLVAEGGSGVIGHIAFSPVTVTREDGSAVSGMGLAPLAVLPAHQRAGVGSQLVVEGLRRLRAEGHPFCVVLGDPRYYARFGFVAAAGYGIRWEHPAPPESFRVQELAENGLAGVSGVVRYRPELEQV